MAPEKRQNSDTLRGDSFARRLCARVRELRKRNGWSLDQLSTGSGVSRSMLSEIERGHANPTVAVTCRIAQAFSLSVGELVDEPGARSRIELIPSDDPAYLFRADRKCRIRTLSPLHMEKDIEIYELQLKPGAALESSPHYQGTREFLTVQRGTVRVTSDKETRTVKRGASAHYRADVLHAIENIGKGECIVFLVVTYA